MQNWVWFPDKISGKTYKYLDKYHTMKDSENPAAHIQFNYIVEPSNEILWRY